MKMRSKFACIFLFFIMAISMQLQCQGIEKNLSTAVEEGNFVDVMLELKKKEVLQAIKSDVGHPVLATALNSRFRWLMIRYLLWSGANVNTVDNNGWSALGEAVSQCDYEYVRFFLSHGADATKRTADGKTLLMIIGNNGSDDVLKIAKLLLKNGVDPAVISPDGLDAALYAKKINRSDLLHLLRGYLEAQATSP